MSVLVFSSDTDKKLMDYNCTFSFLYYLLIYLRSIRLMHLCVDYTFDSLTFSWSLLVVESLVCTE